jgi:hypothetical protein
MERSDDRSTERPFPFRVFLGEHSVNVTGLRDQRKPLCPSNSTCVIVYSLFEQEHATSKHPQHLKDGVIGEISWSGITYAYGGLSQPADSFFFSHVTSLGSLTVHVYALVGMGDDDDDEYGERQTDGNHPGGYTQRVVKRLECVTIHCLILVCVA